MIPTIHNIIDSMSRSRMFRTGFVMLYTTKDNDETNKQLLINNIIIFNAAFTSLIL